MSLNDKEFDRMFEEEFGPTQEDSLFDMTLQMFRGRALHVTVMVMTVMFAFLGLAVYSAVAFFNASDTKDLLLWSVLFLYSGLCVAMLKMWTWMDINKNAVTREVKRLELQIAQLRAGQRDAAG